MLQKLTDPKYENCWVCCTDPADVARVESKTVISTRRQSETIPQCKEGVQGRLGRWMSPGDLEQALDVRTPGCMKGRTMYSAFEIEIKKRVKCIFTGKYYFSVSDPIFRTRFTSSHSAWAPSVVLSPKSESNSPILHTWFSPNMSWPE